MLNLYGSFPSYLQEQALQRQAPSIDSTRGNVNDDHPTWELSLIGSRVLRYDYDTDTATAYRLGELFQPQKGHHYDGRTTLLHCAITLGLATA